MFEIAARLQIHRDTVARWKRLSSFPRPRWLVSNKEAWNWSEVLDWVKINKPEVLEDAA